ncbi:hypothetical protein D3C80_1960050 [compost metagenome]
MIIVENKYMVFHPHNALIIPEINLENNMPIITPAIIRPMLLIPLSPKLLKLAIINGITDVPIPMTTAMVFKQITLRE